VLRGRAGSRRSRAPLASDPSVARKANTWRRIKINWRFAIQRRRNEKRKRHRVGVPVLESWRADTQHVAAVQPVHPNEGEPERDFANRGIQTACYSARVRHIYGTYQKPTQANERLGVQEIHRSESSKLPQATHRIRPNHSSGS